MITIVLGEDGNVAEVFSAGAMVQVVKVVDVAAYNDGMSELVVSELFTTLMPIERQLQWIEDLRHDDVHAVGV